MAEMGQKRRSVHAPSLIYFRFAQKADVPECQFCIVGLGTASGGQFEFKGLAGPFVVRGSCRDFKALVETSAHYCLTSQPYRNIATEIERDRPGSYADDFLMRYGRGPRLSRRHAGVRFVAWIS